MAQKGIPKQLFHYTTREAALEYILPTRRIRLGLVGTTNDPREVKEWSPVMLNTPEWHEDGVPADLSLTCRAIRLIQDEANRIRREEWKVLCLTRHQPDLTSAPFPSGYCRPGNWAHYAENHSGVCLIFDGSDKAPSTLPLHNA